MFKIIRIKSDSRSVGRIEVIFDIDAFGNIMSMLTKKKLTIKDEKKENNLYSRWLSLI